MVAVHVLKLLEMMTAGKVACVLTVTYAATLSTRKYIEVS